MQNDITVSLTKLLFSVSFALDAVEHEVVGSTQNHSKRVALLALLIGQKLDMDDSDLIDLAACCVLHDNALTEYICLQRQKGKSTINASSALENLEFHCSKGETNVANFPFCKDRTGVIEYHHENVDGSGLLHVPAENTPIMARIIRICDHLDVLYKFGNCSEGDSAEKLLKVKAHIKNSKSNLYDPFLADTLLDLLDANALDMLQDSRIDYSLLTITPQREVSMCYEDFIKFCEIFAHIIDYKSKFTMTHSSGIAEKTRRLAEFYKLDYDTLNKLYIAALLHDIGKLTTPTDILEKPGKLTPEEYDIMKLHVFYTHKILSEVSGLEDIELWASSHHERLDGSGYFRGATAESLDLPTRILSCIDVYQALVESRPYRDDMSHDKAMIIMQDFADTNKLDKRIVADIGKLHLNQN